MIILEEEGIVLLTKEEMEQVSIKIDQKMAEMIDAILYGTGIAIEKMEESFASLAGALGDCIESIEKEPGKASKYFLSRIRTFHPKERPERTCEGYPPLLVRPHPIVRRKPGGIEVGRISAY